MGRIVVHNIGKKYKRYARPSARLLEWFSGGRYTGHTPHWVLRGISFEVEPGEAVGIVGQNGAGKSTFLKILTGTLQPSEGTVRFAGRVGAILELGMGFHPDFTGTQNAITACQMTGLDNQQIQDLLPGIQEFSELGDYLDQPLRTYSSGMQARLAFSVVTAMRPDILIIDEVLSVGDAYFQHKSSQKIREFKEQGTTLLFVSHSAGAVKSLCDRAILLDEGVMIQDSTPSAVLDYYNAMIAKKKKDAEIRQAELLQGRVSTRSGNKQAEILAVEMVDGKGDSARAFQVGEKAAFECRIRCNEATLKEPTVGILIRDRLGNNVFGTNTYHLEKTFPAFKKGDTIVARFETTLNLGPGNYSLTVALHSGQTHVENNYDWWDNAVVFQVIHNESLHRFIGTAALPISLTFY